MWDWEFSIQDLAQTRGFEGGELMNDAFLELRNRRHI